MMSLVEAIPNLPNHTTYLVHTSDLQRSYELAFALKDSASLSNSGSFSSSRSHEKDHNVTYHLAPTIYNDQHLYRSNRDSYVQDYVFTNTSIDQGLSCIKFGQITEEKEKEENM